MANLSEIIAELNNLKREETLCSKVQGRRNWVIRTEFINNKMYVRYAGSFGGADRFGYLTESLQYMAEHHVRWYVFTYKKDYTETLNKLNPLRL
jgi:hypothetical protein